MRANGTYPGEWTKPAAERMMEAARERNARLRWESPSRSRARASWRVARRDAETVVELTMDEARRLPNMLGRTVPAVLDARGFHGVVVDGVRTLYVLGTETGGDGG